MRKIWIVVLTLLAISALLPAAQVFDEAKLIYQSREIFFGGTAQPRPEGGYDLLWVQPDLDGANNLYFQSFDAQDQPIIPPKAVSSPRDSYKVYNMVPAPGGGYYAVILADNSAYIYRLNSVGEIQSSTLPPMSEHYGYRVFPDNDSGFWLTSQRNKSSAIYISYRAGSTHAQIQLQLCPSNNTGTDYDVRVLADGDALCLIRSGGELKLVRVDSEDGILWQQVLVQADSPNHYLGHVKLLEHGGDHYVVYWELLGDSAAIKVQRLNQDFEAVWAQPLDLIDTDGYGSHSLQALELGDGSFLVAAASGGGDMRVQKFDSSGNCHFTNTTTEFQGQLQDDSIKLSMISPDQYCLSYQSWSAWWKTSDITAQIIGANGFQGQPLVIAQGLPMVHPEKYFASPEGEAVNFLYIKRESDRSSICKRRLQPDGNLGAELALKSSRVGQIQYPLILPCGPNVISAWINHCYSLGSTSIKYQIISRSGQIILPEAGQIPAGGIEGNFRNLKGISLADGSACLAWVEADPLRRIRAQVFDPAGNPQWEADGKIIAEGESMIEDGLHFALSEYENKLFFAWGDGNLNLRIQAYSGGVAMYPMNGNVLLSAADLPAQNISRIQVDGIQGNRIIYSAMEFFGDWYGNYPIWIGSDSFNDQGVLSSIGSTLFDLNGSPFYAVGVDELLVSPAGLIVKVGYYNRSYDFHEMMYYYWMDQYNAQLIDDAGTTHWGAGGHVHGYTKYLTADESGFYYSTVYSFPYDLRKKNYDFQDVFEQECFNRSLLAAVRVGTDAFIGIDSSLNHFVFDSSGNPEWPEDSELFDAPFKEPSMIAIGENAYVNWTNKSKTAVYLQKLDSSLVGVDDPVQASSLITLEAAYPNPFKAYIFVELNAKEDAKVKIGIYNMRGQLVRRIPGLNLSKGVSQITWDGLDEYNKAVASGIYLWRIEAEGEKPISFKTIRVK